MLLVYLLPGVEAEAELLAAITTFFSRVGLSSTDVGIKVSSRKVLAAVLDRYKVPEENFAQVRHLGLLPFGWTRYDRHYPSTSLVCMINGLI